MQGNGNPNCPNDGTNGYYKLSKCSKDKRTQDTGPWNYATTAYVISEDFALSKVFKDFDNIQDGDWGWGVFYPTDSNSVDQRCRFLSDHGGYDCPGGWIPWGKPFQKDTPGGTVHRGAGYYEMGNPGASGGG